MNNKENLSSFNDLQEKDNELKFDIVVSCHVLEHIINPIQFINNIRKFMLPKGLLIIGT